MVVFGVRVGGGTNGLEIGFCDRRLVGRERSTRRLCSAARGEKDACRSGKRGDAEEVEIRCSQRDGERLLTVIHNQQQE